MRQQLLLLVRDWPLLPQNLPFGLMATLYTPECSRLLNKLPVDMSQTFTFPSFPALTRYFPSELKTTTGITVLERALGAIPGCD